jgi:hypothetical protein
MADLNVDVSAIHQLTAHLRTASSEVAVDPELTQVFDFAFESGVSDQLVATNADLERQAQAVAEYLRSLAQAGDRAADQLVQADAELAAELHPSLPHAHGPIAE